MIELIDYYCEQAVESTVLHELLIRKQKRFVPARSTWSYLALIPSTHWTLNVER